MPEQLRPEPSISAMPPREPEALVTRQHTPLFSLLPLEGGAPKGRRLALEAVFSHTGMPTPPRFARLPLPEEGARMILNRASFHIYLRRSRHESPSYQSTHSSFLPPSFGRRCPEGAEVGSRSGIFTCGDTNPASLRSSAPSRGRGENDS